MNATPPEAFAQRVVAVCGEPGAAWLAALPELVARCLARWRLTVVAAFPPSYNYVLAVRRADGSPAVLKLGLPDPDTGHEAAALRLFDGRGAVRLLAEAPEDRALLLEQAQPGTTLIEREAEDDERATATAAAVMRALYRPATHELPSPLAWAERAFPRLRATFGGGTGPLDAALVVRAEELFPALHHSRPATVVLHADLHHYNILDGGPRGPLAIDPHGRTGDPAYEPAALLRNPLDIATRPDSARILTRRARQLAGELGYDEQRVRAWALVGAVLSACWSVESNGERGWQRAMHVAACFAR